MLTARIWTVRVAAVILLASVLPSVATAEESAHFYSVKGAKDCAFDESQNRLYVTAGDKLVIIDTKEHKTVESIDLAGSVQACDISPDFKHLAIAPIKAQYI